MSETDGRSSTFLGMTKVQFLGVATGLFALLTATAVIFLGLQIGANGQLAREANRQADENARLIEKLQANDTRLDDIADELHRSSCAQKLNAQKQVEQTADFLARGVDFSANGISRAELIQSLERQRAYRDAFSGIDCG